MKIWYALILWIIVIAAILAVGFIMTGCRCPQSRPEPIPDSTREAFIKTVYKTNWLVTVGIISIVVSAIAFKNGAKGAADWLLGSILLVGVTLAVIRLGMWLAIVCMAAGVGWLLYTLFIKNRALAEIIETVEQYKRYLATDSFTESSKGYIKNNIQSPETTKLVSKIKGE